ncbi:MAG: M48 family metallopeptidase [Bacteroidales bacterium]|nr:M48 family metallopeptidase [Bacteroidales bacterium]
MFFFIRRRRRRKRTLTAEQAAEVERLRIQAKAALPPRLAELAALHGFTYNTVRIKHNVSNWGSCSELGNINLNLNLMRVPEHLRDYVMLHELCHLRYMNHGPEFHALLEDFCPDHRALARELKGYKLI